MFAGSQHPQIQKLSVLAVLGYSVWEDLRSRKIKNKTVLISFAICAVMAVTLGGLPALGWGLVSVMLALLASTPLFMAKVLGGGDVKIFAAVSVLLSAPEVVYTLLASLIWGALLGVLSAVLRGQGKALFQNVFAIFMRVKPQESQLHKIPYSVALLFGYLSQHLAGGLW